MASSQVYSLLPRTDPSQAWVEASSCWAPIEVPVCCLGLGSMGNWKQLHWLLSSGAGWDHERELPERA